MEGEALAGLMFLSAFFLIFPGFFPGYFLASIRCLDVSSCSCCVFALMNVLLKHSMVSRS